MGRMDCEGEDEKGQKDWERQIQTPIMGKRVRRTTWGIPARCSVFWPQT